MKTITLICLFLCFSINIIAQKRVSDLNPKHAVALERFLSANKKINFMSENVFENTEPGYLKEMSKSFGKKLVPFYQVGDFNNDKKEDFAMILSREGEPQKTDSTAPGFDYDFPLLIVIFNGRGNGSFQLAFKKEIEVPLFCFLNKTDDKREPLYFGVFESDADTMSFAPAGRGYIAQGEGR